MKGTLRYYMLHRFEIFSAHCSIRLPPCSLAIIILILIITIIIIIIIIIIIMMMMMMKTRSDGDEYKFKKCYILVKQQETHQS